MPVASIVRMPTASSGSDDAYLEDSASNDFLRATSTFVVLRGSNYEFFNYADGFDRTYSSASTGYDEAYFEDSAGNDVFTGTSTSALMRAQKLELL